MKMVQSLVREPNLGLLHIMSITIRLSVSTMQQLGVQFIAIIPYKLEESLSIIGNLMVFSKEWP